MPLQPLKLVSVNIEGHKHLDLIIPFLKSERTDIVCLQEVYEQDFAMIAESLGMRGVFAPMTLVQLNTSHAGPNIPWGVGMLAKPPFTGTQKYYYYGNDGPIPVFADNIKTMYKVLVTGIIQKDGTAYTVGTTHFTWTPDGQADANQRRDMTALLRVLTQFPEIIFCGDFNAPRGRETFSILAAHYKDNIPKRYTASIDGDIHRDGKLQVMVDGLFSTPHYRATNVKLINGVSDHCAIVADIYRA